MAEQADARRAPITGAGALDVLKGVDEVYATRGRDLIHLDLRGRKPDRKVLLGLMLGPTGNLRAPTLRIGRTLVVGFDEDIYTRLLG